MTRGKWVALAVGVAAIAVASPRLLYQTEMRALVFHSGFKMYEFGEVLHSPLERNSFVEIRRWRFSWPRNWRMFDARVECGWCLRSLHEDCPHEVSGRGWTTYIAGRAAPGLIHRCACPHPSHAQESE